MQKKKLKNGITVIINKKDSDSVAIEFTFRVGSNYEESHLLGISHFLEHLLFDGTTNRSSRQVAYDIEKYGGEINALTSNERTSFYVKIPKKYFDEGFDVLSDIIINPLFLQEEIDKEKTIIVDEINMVNDMPMYYQWLLFLKTLYKKSNTRHPVYGSKETVKSLTRENLVNYYNDHYHANNMIITLIGGVPENAISVIENRFKDFRARKEIEPTNVAEEHSIKAEHVNEKKNVDHTYMVLGYKSPNRVDADSYVFDVIRVILGGGMSSRLFNEIRLKRALAYTVGVQHDSNKYFGYFAVYLSTENKNIELCREIILKEIKDLENVTDQEIKDAKTYLEGQYLLENEDNIKRADNISSFEISSSYEHFETFLKHINAVSLEDIRRVSKKYLNDFYTMITLEEK